LRKPLIVAKLGGSALTEKTRGYTPKLPVIRRAANQVASLLHRFDVVLVHGAGSFGHIPAKRWKLDSGFRSGKQLRGLAETKSSLLHWESIIDKVFIKCGIPLVPFFPSDFIVLRKGRIASAELRPLRRWLRLGYVPSTGGDVVPDVDRGFAILSGDQLAAFLAVELDASSLIFGLDIDGVYDSNPKLNPRARLLRELTPSLAARLALHEAESSSIDVTGGMGGKLKEAVVAARKGIPVYFVNLAKGDRLSRVAMGLDTIRTRIA